MKKTYWQAMDGDGKVYLFHDEKPTCDDGEYYSCHSGKYTDGITFPIPLKPLQIAEITVNDNGTWTWEIEREEGWYSAAWTQKTELGTCVKTVFIKYENGFYYYPSRAEVSQRELKELTISSTRIPDKCII